MKTILFQGDSITDASRNRELDTKPGMGYATMVSGKLGLTYPGKYSFLNRGISGNRIVDVYARIQEDIINIKPDYMSLLIGVNDVWHELRYQKGVSADKYEKVYRILLEEILENVNGIKIMLLEPFVLPGTATEEHWESFDSEVRKRAERARRIAEECNLTFIPLQDKFDEAVKLAPPSYWLCDGVHPTSAGHALITNEWITAFERMIGDGYE